MSNVRVKQCETGQFGLPIKRINVQQQKKSTCNTKKLVRTIDRSINQSKCQECYFGSYTETCDQTLKTIKSLRRIQFIRHYVVKVIYRNIDLSSTKFNWKYTIVIKLVLYVYSSNACTTISLVL